MIKLRASGPSRAPGLHQGPLCGAFLPSCPNSGAPLPRKRRYPDTAGLKEPHGRPVRAPGSPRKSQVTRPDTLSPWCWAAARENVLAVLRPFLGAMPALADPGYEGAGHGVHVPVKKPSGVKEPDINTRTRNALLRSARCLGERGFALLTQRWQTLQHVTASPGKIGQIARAALVLVLFEHKMLA